MFELKVHDCLSNSGCDLDDTAWIAVDQHTGLLLMRLHCEYSALLCRKHGNALFLKATAWTLVFGWWGVISIFITPGTLLKNIHGFGKFRDGLRSRKDPPRLKRGLGASHDAEAYERLVWRADDNTIAESVSVD